MTSAARYSGFDRLLHNLAFGGMGLQRNVAEIEDLMNQQDLARISAPAPVFIASLARAGTTQILNTLMASAAFATHTYREMPFLLCPLLWDKVSAPFREGRNPVERDHGDGMLMDYDSPEAFEEAFWQAYWPNHYLVDRITPWQVSDTDRHGEFPDFLARHMRKLVLLRRRQGRPGVSRYLSKNNGNIARLQKLTAIFPDAQLIVPFRDPLEHAASLLDQHLRFRKLQAEDPFARRYMESIGHFDFGEALKPVNFSAWLDAEFEAPQSANFWLRYWIVTFETVLANPDKALSLISYERLCARSSDGVEKLFTTVGLPADSVAIAAAGWRESRSRAAPLTSADPALVDQAKTIHACLLERSLI